MPVMKVCKNLIDFLILLSVLHVRDESSYKHRGLLRFSNISKIFFMVFISHLIKFHPSTDLLIYLLILNLFFVRGLWFR